MTLAMTVFVLRTTAIYKLTFFDKEGTKDCRSIVSYPAVLEEGAWEGVQGGRAVGSTGTAGSPGE